MSVPTSAAPANSRVHTNQWLRGIVFTALFSALFIAASFIKIPLPFGPVPITLQSFAVMLAGGLLGAVYGFWSIFIVVLLTAFGLPLMNGTGGLSQVLGPTGGFIWMFPFAALLIGWLSDKLFSEQRKLTLLQTVCLLLGIYAFGSLLLNVTGVPWLAHYSPKLDLYGAYIAGMYPFFIGDAIKAVVAALVISALRPALPAIRPLKNK
jgi:biotin transport system substrate-specific component